MATSQLPEDLHKGFLDEMQALENFRLTYTSIHSSARVEREDPEVRRLIDAMAFFTARTRVSALRNLLATQRRLFQQFFSFLITPMPAMAMLRVTPTGRFGEPTVVPRDTDLLVGVERGKAAFFHTLADLHLFPLRLEEIDTLLRAKSGLRVVLGFHTPYARNDELGTLRLFINHLNDYPASANVRHYLQKHLERAFVVFDEKPNDASDGAEAPVTWGAPEEGTDSLPDLTHPLQRIRTFFHFPQGELFMNVKMPKGARNWKKFYLCLDLDGEWPKGLRLNKDMFQLFTVPISNLKRTLAEPILCEGTVERHRLRHPVPPQRFALHSVIGVFEILEKGTQALKPGMVSGGNGSYEVEQAPEGEAPGTWLKLEFPEAFENPRKITVDALWHQPWFSTEGLSGKLLARFANRNVVGTELELAGDVRQQAENPLKDDFEGLLHVLALKGKPVLSLDDIRELLGALGTVEQSYMRQLPSFVYDLAVKTVPGRGKGAGSRTVYSFRANEADATVLPLILAGLRQLAHLLRAWTQDAELVVEAQFAGNEEVITLG